MTRFKSLNILPLWAVLVATASMSAPQAGAQSYTYQDIGTPAQAGSASAAGNGFAVSGGGTNIFGTSDQFGYNYQQMTGDFDVKIRIDTLAGSDPWAKAGLMARESLAPNGRHASVFATPSVSGTFFSARIAASAATTNIGTFPVAYPNTWLRLRRAGSTFTGYAGVDGQNWSLLGSATLAAATNEFYVGMAATAASATGAATAQFRDQGDATGGNVGGVTVPFEPIGPSSRASGLIVSEFMYHPKTTNDSEFIEIYNTDVYTIDLGGYRISGSIGYTFPNGTSIAPGALLVVARNPAALQARSGFAGALGPWDGATTNALPDDNGRIRLRHKAGAVMVEINYSGGNPWPVAADGTGHSLVLARPSYGADDPRAWALSDRIGGSPGRLEPFSPDPLRSVVINEFLAHTDPPLEDYIELYNHSGQAVDISGAYLSDDRDTNKFRIPNNTILQPRGFISFVVNSNTAGFSLSSAGERIYFVNPSQTRVIDAVAFEAQANAVSSGRTPDGAPGFRALASRSPGASNGPPLIGPIVINEIMFHPSSEDDNDEYVELYNRSGSAVDVSGWRFTEGINFRFPANTVIGAGNYLVVAKSATNLIAKYTQLNATNTLGDYGGTLGNGGERIALAMPDFFVATNNNIVVTQANYVVVDEVRYDDAGRWSQWADGGGSSLELIDPNADNASVANWADSDETAKGEWISLTHSEVTDNIYPRGSPGSDQNEVQIMILGAGEVLVDDIEVRVEAPTSGPNLLANGAFNNGLTGWARHGNHIQTSLEPAGPNNPSASLRIRATGGGDNGANRVESDLTGVVAPNATAGLRAKVRWLTGHRDVLFRLHGGGMERVFTLPVPRNLGTPGLANSRRVSNAGPTITDVSHSPAVPAANEPVVVTARVSDPDGVATVELLYRNDPAQTLTTLAMNDAGTGGDAWANDGIYSATLSGFSTNLIAFRIQARDAQATAGTTLFPPDAPRKECLIRFGDATYFGNIGVYRLWMTQSNINEWSTRERLSNEALDGTFVYNNYRVIYNAGARYRGSPFIRPGYNGPTGSACGYVWSMPEDDLLLGEDELNLDSLEPQGRDSTALREITSFTMLEQIGFPFSRQRFVHVVINGITAARRNIPIYTDSQQPNSSYIASWFPDESDGEIFKIDDWFEFTDSPIGMQANKSASLQVFTTTGGFKKKARYRNNWEKKFNRGLNDDYTSIFLKADALNAPNAVYPDRVESIIEVEEWLGAIAFRHVIGDWDGYGYSRGKNQFCYRIRNGKFWMLQWDLDFSLGCNGGHPPTQGLFDVALEGDTGQNHMPEINRMFTHPQFRRSYLRTLERIAEGPLQTANFMPTLDARYRNLQANAVASTSPHVNSGAQNISIPLWLRQRYTNIYGNAGIRPFTNVTFQVTSPFDITTTSNLISITGSAPLRLKDLIINGQRWAVTWNSVTSWTARVLLNQGANTIRISGVDYLGNANTSTQTITATFNGQVASPVGAVVFNEIGYNPTIPGAAFVEIWNRSNDTFDIGGWRVNGIDYTFPNGTLLAGGQIIVLAEDSSAFAAAYGTNVTVFALYGGQLDVDGETLSLIKPGATPAQDLVIDRVRYENRLPWATAAATSGATLQLIDGEEDNSRPSNWDAGLGWTRASRSGNIGTGTNVLLWLTTSVGNCFVDDISLVGPDGQDILENGGFETGTTAPWDISANYATSFVTSDISHSGRYSLFLNGTSAGGTLPTSIQQLIETRVIQNTNYTLTFWSLPNTSAVQIAMRTLPGNSLQTNTTPRAVFGTPGAANVFADARPAYDTVWLNELQPDNTAGIRDNNNEREPWIELYNAGSTTVSLQGYYLANNYTTNLTQWAFPNGTSLAPGEYKIVWADGEASETTATQWHTSFRLNSTTGSVALVRIVNTAPQITDYLTYSGVRANLSYGDFPNGQPFFRRIFQSVTPGAANVARDVNVFINEWMASNTNSITDPADGDFDDWFELYNAGDTAVDLGGFYLTDNLANRNQSLIPNNGQYVIPPGGFLLVWADGEQNQNNANRQDLHVSFQLSRTGESIGLFTADGQQIDAVTFGAQTDDVSQGRFADGANSIFDMATPTPRAPNALGGGGNRQPQISPISDRTVLLGQTLSFTVSASDPDAGQTLSYELVGGLPAGATLNPTTGAFSWTPTPAQAPSVNSVTVRVTDSGTPRLSATRSFTITVSRGPVAKISVIGGNVSLAFDTVPGKTYRVVYKDALDSSPNWTPLGADMLATGPTLTIPDTIGARPQRFYRIVQLD